MQSQAMAISGNDRCVPGVWLTPDGISTVELNGSVPLADGVPCVWQGGLYYIRAIRGDTVWLDQIGGTGRMFVEKKDLRLAGELVTETVWGEELWRISWWGKEHEVVYLCPIPNRTDDAHFVMGKRGGDVVCVDLTDIIRLPKLGEHNG